MISPHTTIVKFLMRTKVPILKEVTSEKCNSVELNTFSTYLSSLLSEIAEYLSEVYFFQNWYFSSLRSADYFWIPKLWIRPGKSHPFSTITRPSACRVELDLNLPTNRKQTSKAITV